MESFKIKTDRTAKLSVIGTLNHETNKVWIVLHGYGQLSEYFMKNFDHENESGLAIIAPEGLSRFYTEGLSGRVGASWMTKEEREDEIEDNNHYLTRVEQFVREQCGGFANKEWNVLAFSQGVPVACRWLVASGLRPKKLVLWAGMMPSDVKMPDLSTLFSEAETHLVMGSRDPFLNDENLKTTEDLIRNHNWKLHRHTFEGEHQMNRELFDYIRNQ